MATFWERAAFGQQCVLFVMSVGSFCCFSCWFCLCQFLVIAYLLSLILMTTQANKQLITIGSSVISYYCTFFAIRCVSPSSTIFFFLIRILYLIISHNKLSLYLLCHEMRLSISYYLLVLDQDLILALVWRGECGVVREIRVK